MKCLGLILAILASSCVVSEPSNVQKSDTGPTPTGGVVESEPTRYAEAPPHEDREPEVGYSWEEFHFETGMSRSVLYFDTSHGPTVRNLTLVYAGVYKVDQSYPVTVTYCRSFADCLYEKRVELKKFNQVYMDLENPKTNWFITEEYFGAWESIFVNGELEIDAYTIIIIDYKRGARLP